MGKNLVKFGRVTFLPARKFRVNFGAGFVSNFGSFLQRTAMLKIVKHAFDETFPTASRYY